MTLYRSHLQHPHLAQQGGQERRLSTPNGAHHHEQLPRADLSGDPWFYTAPICHENVVPDQDSSIPGECRQSGLR